MRVRTNAFQALVYVRAIVCASSSLALSAEEGSHPFLARPMSFFGDKDKEVDKTTSYGSKSGVKKSGISTFFEKNRKTLFLRA